MSSWSIQDNAGTTTSITEAEVLKFAAGTGITSTLTSVTPPILEISSTTPSNVVTGTTTGTGGISAVTQIRTLTLNEYQTIAPAADVLYIIL